ncbi:MAG: hypothetical protein CBC06_006150 [bacterium TMED46]|nr:MAG: hypothetical protein CBC06_006150 [bacterium TMED46]
MSLTYAPKIPWGGDEWFSYNNFTIMGLPFSIMTSIMKSLLGDVSIENFLIYRQQGLIWSTLLYIIFTIIFIKSKSEKVNGFIIFYIVFISVNPYFIQTIEFFRYYTLYFFSTSVITLFLLYNDDKYFEKRYMFFSLTVLCLFIHLFLFIQLITYIFIKEFIKIKRKLYFITAIAIISFTIIPNLAEILSYLHNALLPIYNHDYILDHRGFSLSTIIKPIMIIFTFLFGRYQTPLSSYYIDILFTIYGLIIVYGTYKVARDQSVRHPMILAGIAPYIISIFLIEPISLPQMTQIAPQHVLFLFPWIVFGFYYLFIKSKIGIIASIILWSGTIYASYLSQTMDFIDYDKIVDRVPSDEIPIISDAPAQFEFFIESNDIVWFRDDQKVKQVLNNNGTIGILIGNWKLYSKLEPLQFWHNPLGTELVYNSLNRLLDSLRLKQFSLYDSYSFFPVQFYLFKKNESLFNAIPWFYDMKYKDLILPLYINDDKVIGFEKIYPGQKISMESKFYYFIQSSSKNEKKNVIELSYGDGTVKSINLNIDDDQYRSLFCRSIEGDSIAYTFNKMPLISNSMKYPGSIFRTEFRIYQHINNNDGYSFEIKDPELVMIKAIIANNL